MMRFIIPFVAFVVIPVFLYQGLNSNPREAASPLVGKPVPAFTSLAAELQNK